MDIRPSIQVEFPRLAVMLFCVVAPAKFIIYIGMAP